jgi:hypothetical protein
MRAFFAACAAVIVIGLCAAGILNGFLQEPVAAAFATTAARVSMATPGKPE